MAPPTVPQIPFKVPTPWAGSHIGGGRGGSVGPSVVRVEGFKPGLQKEWFNPGSKIQVGGGEARKGPASSSAFMAPSSLAAPYHERPDLKNQVRTFRSLQTDWGRGGGQTGGSREKREKHVQQKRAISCREPLAWGGGRHSWRHHRFERPTRRERPIL